VPIPGNQVLEVEPVLEEPRKSIGSLPSSAPAGPGGTVAVTAFGIATMVTVAFDSVARNLALPQILDSLGMSVTEGGAIFGAAFVVTFLANTAIGPVSDRLGRKRALQLALLAAGLFSGLTAFVTSPWQYAVIGALAGCCLVVQTPLLVIVGEVVGPRSRSLAMAVVIGSFSGGSLIVGVVAAVLLPSGHWRVLFLFAFAPLVLLVISQFAIREPRRAEEAVAVKHGRVVEPTQLTHKIDVDKARQGELKQLFAPDLRRQTLVTSSGGLLMNLSTGFVLALTATYFELYYHLPVWSVGLSVSIEATAALAGSVVVGLLGGRYPARNLLVGFSIAGAIAVGLMAVPGDIAWAWAMMACFGFFGQGALGAWSRYQVESFPTRVRGTASGFVNGFFFLGNAVAPAAFGALIDAGLFPVTALAAAVLAGGGALILLLGRKQGVGRELEELIT
jgi:MFS family permease